MKNGLLIFLVALIFVSCTPFDDTGVSTSTGNATVTSQKKWTVVVYMAADNSLESFGIADLNEIEAVNKGTKVNVLVLLDRASGYDATNSNWTDTRLFLAGYDKENSNNIISKRLDCQRLGLSAASETELDMADRNTLSGVLSFAVENYKADHYGLIIWGHGASSGFANDSYSGNRMTISQLKTGIQNGTKGEKLDVVAFDTCFGVNAENLYELKDCAEYVCGTSGLVSDYGWNYEKLFNGFVKSNRSPEDFCISACEAFKTDYENYSSATFSAFKLKEFSEAVKSFDSACRHEAEKVDSYLKRDELLELIQNRCVTYTGVTFPCDCYVDMYSLASILSETEGSDEIWNKTKSDLENSCVCSWNNVKLKVTTGVFYSTYIGKKITASSHPSYYVNGSGDYEQCRFVREMTGWVPGANDGQSLLEKIFYEIYSN